MVSIFVALVSARQPSATSLKGILLFCSLPITCVFFPGRILKKRTGCIKCDWENAILLILSLNSDCQGKICLTVNDGYFSFTKSIFPVVSLSQAFSHSSSNKTDHSPASLLQRKRAAFN